VAHLHLSGAPGGGCNRQCSARPLRYDSPMAQGLGEYGMLVGGKAAEGSSSSSLENIVGAIEEAIRNPTPRTWAALGAFLFILWFFLLRRRR
jgi:hypothetical protein